MWSNKVRFPNCVSTGLSQMFVRILRKRLYSLPWLKCCQVHSKSHIQPFCDLVYNLRYTQIFYIQGSFPNFSVFVFFSIKIHIYSTTTTKRYTTSNPPLNYNLNNLNPFPSLPSQNLLQKSKDQTPHHNHGTYIL